MDDDGAPDLLVAGHEYEDQPTVIYWGDRSGTYDASRKTTLPAVPGRGVVVDIDAEDLDGDGDRDIVLSRTSSEPFYAGYYVQVVAGHGSRRSRTRPPGESRTATDRPRVGSSGSGSRT